MHYFCKLTVQCDPVRVNTLRLWPAFGVSWTLNWDPLLIRTAVSFECGVGNMHKTRVSHTAFWCELALNGASGHKSTLYNDCVQAGWSAVYSLCAVSTLQKFWLRMHCVCVQGQLGALFTYNYSTEGKGLIVNVLPAGWMKKMNRFLHPQKWCGCSNPIPRDNLF